MFVVIEGVDGCGKSTQAKLLKEHLESKGNKVLLTAEPTKGFIGQAIRMILSGKIDVSSQTLALLFTADRAEHLDKVIRPALAKGEIVVCERYYYSTVAYQSAQGVSQQWIMDLNSFAPEPDLVVLLDIPPEEALPRIRRDKEVFEVLEFQKKVAEALLDFAYRGRKKYPRAAKTAWKVIDAKAEKETVAMKIIEAVDSRLLSK